MQIKYKTRRYYPKNSQKIMYSCLACDFETNNHDTMNKHYDTCDHTI